MPATAWRRWSDACLRVEIRGKLSFPLLRPPRVDQHVARMPAADPVSCLSRGVRDACKGWRRVTKQLRQHVLAPGPDKRDDDIG